ncbi:ATP-binding protein [Microcoleus sp. FACHB-SPT15]|uniref:DUF6272 family protein n=1 Tax=Microcoleus sp. FACHB-SPT15 TaxID=2692830 RepID=UPI00177A84B8|nr:DUF6272 family protein [Microcoleus sp. FACHB-SPT15]MBD1806716.1 ATP-binding protein [Microcoleus sp. FACHB-SPT15]
MTQIFGDFHEDLPVVQEYLTLFFSPSSVPVKQRWRTNGLSADFMADYFATFFPGNEGATTEDNIQREVKSAVSFIGNELLENAMKFSDETSDHPISLTLQMHSDRLVFLATNSVNPKEIATFQNYIQELTTSDPDELYIRHLEENAEDEHEHASQLGLLTMMNDYQAKLGWKFESVQNDPDAIAVTTMVQLTL